MKVQKQNQNQKQDIDLNDKQQIPTIYFDESGNTGSNLIDLDQPVFTLASCIFSKEISEELLKLIDSNSIYEVHFKNLRRRKSGQDAIIRLMSSKLLDVKCVRINIFLKESLFLC